MGWDLALPFTAAGSGALWAGIAAGRAGPGRVPLAARALVAGVAAFGLASAAYELAALLGLSIRWERVLRGDLASVALVALIGAIEESAKLAGIALVVERATTRRKVLAAAGGVAAGFAVLEALLASAGDASAPAMARLALAPVAHALLAIPLAVGLAAALRRPRGRWVPISAALLASAALHAAGDLSLALPQVGRAGYALALATPALALFASARARRRKEKGSARLADPARTRFLTTPGSTGGRPVSRQVDPCPHRSPTSTPHPPRPHPGPAGRRPPTCGSREASGSPRPRPGS